MFNNFMLFFLYIVLRGIYLSSSCIVLMLKKNIPTYFLNIGFVYRKNCSNENYFSINIINKNQS